MLSLKLPLRSPVGHDVKEVLRDADAKLRGCPQFAGHAECVQVNFTKGRLVISGRVPTFYLKSLLQHTLSGIDGVESVDNLVQVVSSDGLSSVSHAAHRPAEGHMKGGQP